MWNDPIPPSTTHLQNKVSSRNKYSGQGRAQQRCQGVWNHYKCGEPVKSAENSTAKVWAARVPAPLPETSPNPATSGGSIEVVKVSTASTFTMQENQQTGVCSMKILPVAFTFFF